MRVVVAVGWRAGDPQRERNWETASRWWGTLMRLPIFTADSDPERPFSLTQAVNRAVEAARPFDVVVIPDADTILSVPGLEAAVRLAHAKGHMVFPATRYWRLSPSGGSPARPELHHAGGVHVFSREAWDTLGGYDERFDRWGGHDSAMLWAAATLHLYSEVEGDAYHLYHETESGPWTGSVKDWADACDLPDAPEGYSANGPRPVPPLAERYRAALGDRDAMLAILAERARA